MIRRSDTFSHFPALPRWSYHEIPIDHRFQVAGPVLVHGRTDETPEVEIMCVLLTKTRLDVLRRCVIAVEDVGQQDSRANGLNSKTKRSGGWAADGNGVVEEGVRLRGDDGVAREGGTCRLTEDRYLVGITVEGSDVFADPLECRLDVPQTIITGKRWVLLIQHNSKAEFIMLSDYIHCLGWSAYTCVHVSSKVSTTFIIRMTLSKSSDLHQEDNYHDSCSNRDLNRVENCRWV